MYSNICRRRTLNDNRRVRGSYPRRSCCPRVPIVSIFTRTCKNLRVHSSVANFLFLKLSTEMVSRVGMYLFWN